LPEDYAPTIASSFTRRSAHEFSHSLRLSSQRAGRDAGRILKRASRGGSSRIQFHHRAHVLITQLWEAFVELADCAEIFGGQQGDEFVGLCG
jgi:hypothetical protein